MTTVADQIKPPSPDTTEKKLAAVHPAALNQFYRRAILIALEDLRDIHSRSNLDLIQGRTRTILEDTGHPWNELIFVQTLKTAAQSGDIALGSHVWAELSPNYKRKRAESLSRKMQSQAPVLPATPPITIPTTSFHCGDLKEAPARKPELEKWKIMPKKLYDKTIVLNPMDTH